MVNIQKILIIAIGGIGDILRLFPVFSALRKHYPKIELTVVAIFNEDHDVWALLPEEGVIEKILHFDVNGIHKTIFNKLRLIQDLRRENFDLIIDTSRGDGMAPNSIMSFLIGGKYRVGFQNKGIGFLHHIKVPFTDDQYIGAQNLHLLSAIGIRGIHPHIRLQLPQPNAQTIGVLEKIRKPIITIHPGAQWNGWQRCWPTQQYAGLIKRITEELDAAVILLGDSRDKELNEKIRIGLDLPNIMNIAGKTSLSEAAHIISYSHLFIGNDSALLHLAAALETPSIGIFGPTSPLQVMPKRSYIRAVYHDLSCRPCYDHQPLYENKCSHKECLTKLNVEQVMAKVRSMIKIRSNAMKKHKVSSQPINLEL
jgi:lipopolysaccharide heptosyltransferase II